MSEDRSFGLSTALFHITMYRQYARKVGTSANSALIRYYLPRLKLSIALLSRRRGDERLVVANVNFVKLFSNIYLSDFEHVVFRAFIVGHSRCN